MTLARRSLTEQLSHHARELHQHLEKGPQSNPAEISPLLARSIGLLDGAHEELTQLQALVAQLEADRDAAWRVATAASDGHSAIRARYYDLAEKLAATELDSASDIAHRLTVYVDRQTRSYQDGLRSSERELDAARERIKALEATRDKESSALNKLCVDAGAPAGADQIEWLRTALRKGDGDSAVADAAQITARRAARERGIEYVGVPQVIEALLTEIQTLGEQAVAAVAGAEVSSSDQRDREIADLRQLAAANAEVLQRQGTALGQLQVALLMAGAPKQGDLTAWASNVRNTILGQRREIEDLVERLRINDMARRHELAEIQAAADALPPELKPANGFPYAVMATTPVRVFMLLRERALALVNPSPGAPVSGA
jgi:hypothetical protein